MTRPSEGSLFEHRFGTGPPFTVGLEDEAMILDARTLDLAQGVEGLCPADRLADGERLFVAEMFQSMLELHTPVCDTVEVAARELHAGRARAAELADARGLLLGSAGTHPFSRLDDNQPSRAERYALLVHDLQDVARRSMIFALHVHVAVDDADKAVALTQALMAHVPELVALSASSPFRAGRPSGLASTRTTFQAAYPRTGPTPRLRDYADFVDVVAALEDGGLPNYTHIWWDVRPHPWLGTVEWRCMDAVSRDDDVAAIAAYAQALVRHYSEMYDAGHQLLPPHDALVRESRWRTIRHGLDAVVFDLPGDGEPIAAAELIRRTRTVIEPHARELGSEDALGGIERILREGNGATRQLDLFRRTGDVAAVVRGIVDETRDEYHTRPRLLRSTPAAQP
jgi:glutamate---cysteine ligase / carboxylate-amine ligase